MTPDCSTIDARLAKARATYDAWMNGETVSRFLDQNGESVSYSTGGMSRLLNYIAMLENEKAACLNPTNPLFGYRGPIKFTFGRRPY